MAKAKKNNIRTSKPVASKASKLLKSKTSKPTVKSVAGSDLVNRKKTTKSKK